MIGPPRYSDPGFAIAATYATVTTLIFAGIYWDVQREDNPREINLCFSRKSLEER